jgi:hypothetical protein
MKFLMPRVWKVCQWVWVALIIAIGVGFLASILSSQAGNVLNTVFFSNVGPFLILTFWGFVVDFFIILFIILTCVSAYFALRYGTSASQQVHQTIETISLTHDRTVNTLIQSHDENLKRLSQHMTMTLDTFKKSLQQITQSTNTTSQHYEVIFRKMENDLKVLGEQMLLLPLQDITKEIASLNRQCKDLKSFQAQFAPERQKREALEQSVAFLQHQYNLQNHVSSSTSANATPTQPDAKSIKATSKESTPVIGGDIQ